jgi:hypothetical protein
MSRDPIGRRQQSCVQVERMKAHNARAMAKEHDAHVIEYNKYDPMFLALGITVPLAKRPVLLEPAVKAKMAKAWSKKMDNHVRGRRLRDIVREQNIGRANGWFGPRLVRG